MTDTQFGNKKKANKEHKKNNINRPKGTQNNERTDERYEDFKGYPAE